LVNYAKKTFIYREGQRPRAVFYIVSGKVKTSRTNEDGKTFITHIHVPGEYFSYTAIVEDVNYREEAQTLEDTVLMVIPREDFLQLIGSDGKVARAFIRIITQNISENEDRLLNLAYNSLRKKVAYGLILLLEKEPAEPGGPAAFNLSRENMAQSFGVATESLIRTLSDFKDEKLINMDAGKVVIINEEKLRRLQ
jgi:CRP-like cAMP-binding protein